MNSYLTHPKYRPDIDGLRAVAVLSVVAFHAFPSWIKGGFVGVDVFFVISGYLISRIIMENLDEGRFSFREFYSRRIRRIFPALAVVLLASHALGWFVLLSDEYKQLGKHIAGGAAFVSNLVLWGESGYFDNAAETKPLLHLWSLGVEEQFYIVFPVLLYFSRKLKFSLPITVLAVFIVSFYLNLCGAEDSPIAAFYSPQTRFWELMGGCLLAWAMHHKVDFVGQAGRNFASAAGALLLVYGFFRIGKDLSFPGKWALIPTLGAALVIFAGQNAWINKNILSNRVLVWIGLISFPLYLWHWVLLSFARIMEGDVPAMEIRMSIVVLSFVLAWITWAVIEKPFRFGGWGKAKVLSLVVLMSLIGVLGYCTEKSDGFPSRQSIRKFEMLKPSTPYTHHIGKPAGASIMLLGDSHASHYVPGLKKYFGGSVADHTALGCIPFFDVDRYDSRFVKGACAKSMNAALEYFEKSSQMTGIILASMGPAYLSGEAFNGMDVARVTGDGVRLISRPDVTDRWDVYAHGMRSTLSRLSKANKKILFVLDVPELGFDPHACIDARPVVLASKKRVPCAVSREKYEARVSRYKEMVHSILKEFPAVMVYDPADELCDDKQCWAIKEGRLLYQDFDHLSNEGAFFLIDKMRPLIQELGR